MISGQLARGRPRVGQCRPLGGHSLSAADAGPASAAKAVKGKIAPASRRSEHASRRRGPSPVIPHGTTTCWRSYLSGDGPKDCVGPLYPTRDMPVIVRAV